MACIKYASPVYYNTNNAVCTEAFEKMLADNQKRY
jgi:hypothetical protein